MSCSVPCCSNKRRIARDKSFYRIPLDVETRDAWLRIIGLNSEAKNLYVCEEHFKKEDFVVVQQKKRINRYAKPYHSPQCAKCKKTNESSFEYRWKNYSGSNQKKNLHVKSQLLPQVSEFVFSSENVDGDSNKSACTMPTMESVPIIPSSSFSQLIKKFQIATSAHSVEPINPNIVQQVPQNLWTNFNFVNVTPSYSTIENCETGTTFSTSVAPSINIENDVIVRNPFYTKKAPSYEFNSKIDGSVHNFTPSSSKSLDFVTTSLILPENENLVSQNTSNLNETDSRVSVAPFFGYLLKNQYEIGTENVVRTSILAEDRMDTTCSELIIRELAAENTALPYYKYTLGMSSKVAQPQTCQESSEMKFNRSTSFLENSLEIADSKAQSSHDDTPREPLYQIMGNEGNSCLASNVKITVKECFRTDEEEQSLQAMFPNNKIFLKLKTLRAIAIARGTKIKALQDKLRYRRKKIEKTSCLLKLLKQKGLINEEANEQLSEISSKNKLVERFILKTKGSVPKRYDEQLKTFALNLNFLSPDAYKFVRQNFENCLPHPQTLGSWYANIHCSPGFTEQSFKAIEKACQDAKDKKQSLVLQLSFDEIFIRRQIEWANERTYGYVEIGDGHIGKEEANQILVFMAVAVNRTWKIPLGFFPIASLSAEQKANIIKICFHHLQNTGAKIIGITCDAAATNFRAFKLLGCDITKTNECPKLNFEGFDGECLIHPDPCHMMKLIRNSLARSKTFVDGEDKIKWCFLERLHKLQNNESLHLGNKIRQAHIYFAQQKMKVKLAVQLFSKSVADALDFCREILKLQEFQGSEPLSKFVRVVNDAFDMLNSRKISEPETTKRALCRENANEIKEHVQTIIVYLSHLKLTCGTPVTQSSQKSGFVGMIACLKNIQIIYDKFISTEILHYIPFYKLNQDHLELFFWSIRSNLGRNNNPTVRQFICTYKKLLVRCAIREGGLGNCEPLEQLKYLTILEAQKYTDNPEHEINYNVGRQQLMKYNEKITDSSILNFETPFCDENVDDQFLIEHSYAYHPAKLTEYVSHVVDYIAGFIVFKIGKILNCMECLASLEGEFAEKSLMAYKTKGFLKSPSKSVKVICQKIESILRQNIHNLNEHETILDRKYYYKVIIEVKNYFLERPLFDDSKAHMIESGHYVSLISLIIKKYLNTRYYFIAKKKSEKCSIRQKLTKTIQFCGM